MRGPRIEPPDFSRVDLGNGHLTRHIDDCHLRLTAKRRDFWAAFRGLKIRCGAAAGLLVAHDAYISSLKGKSDILIGRLSVE